MEMMSLYLLRKVNMSEEKKHSHIDWRNLRYKDKLIEYDNHYETEDGSWVIWSYSERYQAQRYLRRHPNKVNKRSQNCSKDKQELKIVR